MKKKVLFVAVFILAPWVLQAHTPVNRVEKIYNPVTAGFNANDLSISSYGYSYTSINKGRIFAPVNAITLGGLPSSICAGSQILFSFSASGTYGPGNTFTAELSDATGSWGSPTVIGTLTLDGTNILDQPITLIIPAGQVAGTNYVIRVKADTPDTTSDDSPYLIIYNFSSTYTVFTETMGNAGTPGYTVNTYQLAKGFDNSNVYNISGNSIVNNISASSTLDYSQASGNANVALMNEVGNCYFEIAGINSTGLSNLSLSFGLYKSTNESTGSELVVDISSDGTNWPTILPLPALPSGAGTTGWYYVTCTGVIPATSTLYIRWTNMANGITDGPTFRIDDITLTGISSVARITPSGTIPFCQSGTLTASIGSHLTNPYTWSPGGETTQAINVTSSNTYAVTITDANGCTASASQAVTVNTINATANHDNPVCSGSALYLHAGGGSITATYSWGGPAAFDDATLKDPTVSSPNPGTYIVTITDEGCSATAETSVYVNYLPHPTISGPSSACKDVTGNVYKTEPGKSNYDWAISPGGQITSGGTSSDSTITVTWEWGGPRWVSVNYTYLGCSATLATKKSVFVHHPPEPSINGPASACVNSTDNVYYTETGMAGYTWTTSAGGTIAYGAGTYDITVTWNNSGPQSVYVNYTDSHNCTDEAVTKYDVTVNPLPIVDAGEYGPYCVDHAAVTLTGSPTGGTFSGTGVNAGQFDPATAGEGKQTITYTYTDANNCTSSATYGITVNALPIVDAGEYGPYCIDHAAVTLTGSPAGGTFSGTGVNAGQFDPATAGAGTQTITYSYTDANNCTSTATYGITVNSLPTVDAGEYGPYCIDHAAVTLTGSPAGGTFSGTGVNAGQFDPATAGAGTQTITYTYTDANNCTSTATYGITVNALPIVDAGEYGPYCIDHAAVTLTGSPAGGIFSGPGVDAGQFDPAVAGAGTQTITYTYTDANNCTSTATYGITVNALPIVDAGTYGPYCADHAVVTLTGSPTGGTFSGPGVDGGQFNPATAGEGTQTITYTYTDANNCTSSATYGITINSLPSATVSSNSPVCTGSTLYLTSGGGTSYNWAGANGFTSSTQNPSITNVTADAAGTYTVTVTGGNGCSATTSTNVSTGTFSSFFDVFTETMGTSPNGSTINAYETANGFDNHSLTMTGAGNVNNGVPSAGYPGASGLANVLLANAGGKYFQIGGINTSGLISLTVSFGVWKPLNSTVTDKLAIEVSSDGTNYAPLTMPEQPAPAGWYYITCTGSIPATANLRIRWTNLSTGGTGPNFRIDDVKLRGSLTAPSITASGPVAFCQGGAVTLTTNPGGSNYYWNTGASTQSITVNASGNYTVTFTATSGCAASVSQNVTVHPTPEIIIKGSKTVCIGSSVVLIANIGEPLKNLSGNYLWSTGATTLAITVHPLVTTTYTVTYTDGFGCTASNSAVVTVLPLPVVSITPQGPLHFCADGSVMLTATQGFQTYTWNPGISSTNWGYAYDRGTYAVTVTDVHGCADTASIYVTGYPILTVTAANPVICQGQSSVVTASGATTYMWDILGTGNSNTATPMLTTTYTVTGTSYGCTATGSVTILVHPTPSVSLSASLSTICNHDQTTITASGPSVSYSWSQNGGTANPIIVTPAVNTAYFVTGTSEFGCTNMASIVITVKPSPSVTLSASPTTLCQGISATLTAGGASTYAWNNGLSPGTPKTVTPAVTTTYIVTGTVANGCTGSAGATITVNPKPALILNATPKIICTGTSSILTATGGAMYYWSGGLGAGTPKTATPTATTVYTVTGTSVAGCTSTASITVTVNPLPTVTASALPATICIGSSSQLTGSGASTYNWNQGLGTGNPMTVFPVATTSYIVTGTSAAGCSATATVKVTVKALPNVTLTANPTLIIAGATSTLTAGGANAYTWSTGLTGNPQQVHPTVTTNYTVTGTNNNTGCSNTATVTVTISRSMVPDSQVPSVEDIKMNKPVAYCYPNPFSDKTTLQFILPDNNHARADIFDITGKWIRTLFDADVTGQTEYKVEFDGTSLPANIYFYRITTNENVLTGKMIMNRE